LALVDDNGAPIVAPSVDENAAGAVIGHVQATDPDGDAITWTVDDARFEVLNGILKLKDNVALDYEAIANHQIVLNLTASDGSLPSNLSITIDIQDTPEYRIANPDIADNIYKPNPPYAPYDQYVWTNVLTNDVLNNNTGSLQVTEWFYNGIKFDASTGPALLHVDSIGDFTGYPDGYIYLSPDANFLGEVPLPVTYTLIDHVGGTATGSVTFIVNVPNDYAAVITEVQTPDAFVIEDLKTTVSGDLDVSDPDAPNQNYFIAQAEIVGAYGSLSIDKYGQWTYTLDNDNLDVQALDTNETLADHIVVQSLDGTPHTIDITIKGLSEDAQTYPFDYNLSFAYAKDFNGGDVIQAVNMPDTSLKGLAKVLSVDIVNGQYQFNLSHDAINFGAGVISGVTPSAGHHLDFNLNNGVSRTAILLDDGNNDFEGHGNYTNVATPFNLSNAGQLIYGLSGDDLIVGDINYWHPTTSYASGLYSFGHDVIVGGDGTSTIVGDVYTYDSFLMGTNSTVLTYPIIDYGDDTLYGAAHGTVIGDISFVQGTDYKVRHEFGGDTIYAPYLGGTAIGDVGNLVLQGAPGTNAIEGITSSRNNIIGSDFDDLLIGNFGNYAQDINSAITLYGTFDIISGNSGNDTIIGDVNFFNIGDISYQNNSSINMGSDTLYGGDGNDLIIGDILRYNALYSPNTALLVTLGSDTIEGGAGDDILVGDIYNLGNAYKAGPNLAYTKITASNDTFVFDLATPGGFGNDRILDMNFNSNKDTLSFKNVLDVDGQVGITLADLNLLTTLETVGADFKISVYSDIADINTGLHDSANLLGTVTLANYYGFGATDINTLILTNQFYIQVS
jgi:VCBS repeat-containing protein